MSFKKFAFGMSCLSSGLLCSTFITKCFHRKQLCDVRYTLLTIYGCLRPPPFAPAGAKRGLWSCLSDAYLGRIF